MSLIQKALILCAALATSSAFADITCNGAFRQSTPQKVLEETSTPLVKIYDGGGLQKFEVDLKQGVYMSATYYPTTNEVLLAIVKAPDYTNGVITRAALSDGKASLAQTQIETQLVVVKDENGNPVAKEVKTDKLSVFRLECSL